MYIKLLQDIVWLERTGQKCNVNANILKNCNVFAYFNTNEIMICRYRRSSSIQQPVPPVPAPISDGEEWWTDEGGMSDNGSTSSTTSLNRRTKKKRHWPPRPKEIVPGNTLAVEVSDCNKNIFIILQLDDNLISISAYRSCVSNPR